MAIWQFRLDLIPGCAIRAKLGIVPTSIPHELAEDFSWWSEVQPPAGFEARIDGILPKADSWSEEMLIWGDERGDTACVCYDETHKVQSFGFRADVREFSLSFIRDICRLANDLECVLLIGEYELIAPSEQAVVAAVNEFTAKKFLDDPVSTLRGLRATQGKFVR